jgi:hypothetical protein
MSDNQHWSSYPSEAPTPQTSSKAPVPQTSNKAVVSLVFGILSYFPLWVIGAIVALIVGYSAKNEIKNSNGRITGDGMATTGIILGWVNIGLAVIGGCVWVVLLLGVFTALGNVQY